MKIKEIIKKKINNIAYKPFFYTNMVKKAYSGGSVCGGQLAGKSVMITGATGGIGEALVRRFLEEKCVVYLVGRNVEKLEKMVDQLIKTYKSADISYVVLDMLKTSEIRKEISNVLLNRNIDILINNSGILTNTDKEKRFRSVSRKQFELVWETNYKGTKELTTMCSEIMNCRGGMQIVNVSSICADSGKFSYTPYGISKKAILQLKQEIEEKYENIVVNSIQPGTVATRMNDTMCGDNITMERNRIHRAALPEEIAAIIVWMCLMGKNIKSQSIVASACEIL